MARLDESVAAIIDGIVDALQAGIEGGSSENGFEALTEVQAIVRGERARPMPKMPALWVLPQPAQQTRGQYGDETWQMPVSIAGLVKSDDAEDGARKSQTITAQARSIALMAKPAIEGSESQVDVTDITSLSFDPIARTSEKNRTLFWTEAVVNVTFTVQE